ncbi:NUDIX domain-containing protein [Altererythrobacter endophyticus]|uniref:GDP-mannose pyrophosphatase n=2 Tax=Altericroceibacterium endophyticum TaxID=1808508 RepID=A0A6I4TAL0_9SPHN|nr:NUDIX hydrolase [Altericroceibacterium endophyticum]MXO66795.1 NUDIX domain-containing protein [Altericroceibacterium endophyticum]
MWSGDWITAKKRGRWEYVSRVRNIRAAVILALDGDDVILVEQYRVPLGRNCMELPAGLVGDLESEADESAFAAAARELEEETGYRAQQWDNLGEYFSSPGMVSESFTLLKATQLDRIGNGGGVDGENITVHRVKRGDLNRFCAEQRAMGKAMDVKLLLLLGAGFLQGKD